MSGPSKKTRYLSVRNVNKRTERGSLRLLQEDEEAWCSAEPDAYDSATNDVPSSAVLVDEDVELSPSFEACDTLLASTKSDSIHENTDAEAQCTPEENNDGPSAVHDDDVENVLQFELDSVNQIDGYQSIDNSSYLSINLFFDCDICVSCRCGECGECCHKEDGESCHHCDYCVSGLGSDYGDSEDSSDEHDAFFVEERELLTEEEKKNHDLKEEFAGIVLKHGFSDRAAGDLLAFFRKHKFGDFPKSSKTLKKTPISTPTKKVSPGEYWHRGITKDIKSFVEASDCSEVLVSFNVDGLPLTKSSKSSLWPISCSLNNSKKVFLAGAYHGQEKPNDPNEFLEDFVIELNNLIENGVDCKGKNIPVRGHLCICDAPAKSFILKVKGHTGYFSCCKCIVEGVMFGRRMSFLDCYAALRTDESFINQEQEEHHNGKTILTDLKNFRPVTDTVVEYMHLTVLGVMRKLVYMLIGGPPSVRQPSRVVNMISEGLAALYAWVPNNFTRRPRSLENVKRFKATEWRMLLFYTGPVVFRSSLPKHLYEHFLVFHAAMVMLARADAQTKYVDYAKELLIYFVKNFALFYGKEYVSHNVHNLIHLPDDVKNHGPVDTFSAFLYENYLQFIKKLIRKGDKPLQQLARRTDELESNQSAPNVVSQVSEKRVLKGFHTDGPLPEHCTNPQYAQLSGPGVTGVNLTPANRCCLLADGTVVLIENFATSKTDHTKVVVGRKFLKVQDLYTIPCNSSLFDIFYVSELSPLLSWSLDSLKSKCFIMPLNMGYAVFPLLHLQSDL